MLVSIAVGAAGVGETTVSFHIHENGPFPPQSYGLSLKILQRSFAWLIRISISSRHPSAQLLSGGTLPDAQEGVGGGPQTRRAEAGKGQV